jgi:hypothetical protein
MEKATMSAFLISHTQEHYPSCLRMEMDKPSHLYTEIINKFLAPKLPPNHNLWFQQDGAMLHMTVINMAVLRNLFPQQVLSHFGDVPWPPCLVDLTAPDFFLWRYLKSKV